MHFNEHGPAHFHVRYAEYEASIEIATLGLLSGSLPRRVLARVASWGEGSGDELTRHWEESQAWRQSKR